MLQILISTARMLLVVAAVFVVAICAIFGGGFAEENGYASIVGTLWGGFLGILLASLFFGTLAAVFDIQRHTKEAVVLLRDLNAHGKSAPKFTDPPTVPVR